MKIKYRKKRLNKNLVLAVLWLLTGLFGLLSRETPSWTHYGFLALSIIYWGAYFYERNSQYLTIENGMIFKNQPFGKKIELDSLTQVKKFAGDYILKTGRSAFTINTHLIDPESLQALDAVLEKWDPERRKPAAR